MEKCLEELGKIKVLILDYHNEVKRMAEAYQLELDKLEEWRDKIVDWDTKADEEEHDCKLKEKGFCDCQNGEKS